MAMKKVDKFANLVKFEKVGDALEGKLVRLRQGETVNGMATFAEVITADETRQAFIVSSGLAIFSLEGYIGQHIKIVYTGEVENVKSKRTFKDFDLFVDEE